MPDTSPTALAATGLARISGPDGTFAIVAMDQRNTCAGCSPRRGDPPTALRSKRSRSTSSKLSAPRPTQCSSTLSSAFPRYVKLELWRPATPRWSPSSHLSEVWEGKPRASRDPQRTAAWVTEMGGDAVKLPVQMRPDRPRQPGEPDLVSEVVDVVQAVADDCAATGVPSVVETLLYRLRGEDPLPPRRRAELIAESARILTEAHPDLLKLEYPVDAQGCRAVAGAVTVPWAMLSAGMPFDAFLDAVITSCEEGGACGFIAGRVYWKEAVALDGAARKQFLASTGRQRLEESVATMSGRARPWAEVRSAQ
jgi:tagatose-1,6-bisphosphate aldolase